MLILEVILKLDFVMNLILENFNYPHRLLLEILKSDLLKKGLQVELIVLDIKSNFLFRTLLTPLKHFNKEPDM